ncbi:unnamed protein product [Rotaria magnacalcarata]|uniref:Uncharacterized protein n=1 Tax=Rotaria magnacalcarata TaxID=392030 RepID=A0A816MWN7_9BILA|nr:unnamed protein product [Rotaria magnacalcarata]
MKHYCIFHSGEPLRSIIPQFLRLDGYVGARHVGAGNPGRLFFPQAIQLTHIQITLNEFCDCASSLDQASSQLCSFTIRIVYVYVGNINTIFQIASISCPYLKQLTMKIY